VSALPLSDGAAAGQAKRLAFRNAITALVRERLAPQRNVGGKRQAPCECRRTLLQALQLPATLDAGWRPPLLHNAALCVGMCVASHGRIHSPAGGRPWRSVVAARVPLLREADTQQDLRFLPAPQLGAVLAAQNVTGMHIRANIYVGGERATWACADATGICRSDEDAVDRLRSAAAAWVQHGAHAVWDGGEAWRVGGIQQGSGGVTQLVPRTVAEAVCCARLENVRECIVFACIELIVRRAQS
jgi:hypothetical protein